MGNLTMTAVKLLSETRGAARYLLYTIADSVSDESGYYDLSVTSLATYTKYTPRYINELLAKLLKSGELVCVERAGKLKQNRYMIPLYPGEPGYSPQPCGGADHICAGNHTPFTRTRYELYTEFYGSRKADALRAFRKTLNHSSESPENGDTLNHSSESTLNHSSESTSHTLNHSSESTLNHSSDKPNKTHQDHKPNNEPNAHARETPIKNQKQKTETAEADPTPNPLPADGLWIQAQSELRKSVSAAQYQTYLTGAKLYIAADDPRRFVLIVPTPYTAEQVRTRFYTQVSGALRSVARGPVSGLDIQHREARVAV